MVAKVFRLKVYLSRGNKLWLIVSGREYSHVQLINEHLKPKHCRIGMINFKLSKTKTIQIAHQTGTQQLDQYILKVCTLYVTDITFQCDNWVEIGMFVNVN